MGTRTILLAAAALALLAIPSSAKDGNVAIRHDRTTSAASPTARAKKLREAKRPIPITVVPTDVRPRRYLAFGDELDTNKGGVLTRCTIAEIAVGA
jgi:hypothetical protein